MLNRLRRKRQRTEVAPSPLAYEQSIADSLVDGSVISNSELTERSTSAERQQQPKHLKRASIFSFASPFTHNLMKRSSTPLFGGRRPVDLDMESLNLDDRDALTRLTDLTREYARLEVYYEEVHRRYGLAKEEMAELRARIEDLESKLEIKERRIRSLKAKAKRQ